MGLGRDNGSSSGLDPGRGAENDSIVDVVNAIRPMAARGGSLLPRAPVCLLALVAACAYLPASGGGGGSGSPPVPKLVERHPWMADTRWPAGEARLPEADQLATATDVEDLLTGDFDVYPVAARRLILRGGVVLPFLGQAAERNPAPAVRKERIAIVLGPVLRELPEERMLVALSSPYVVVRAAAAAAVGERRLKPFGPRLVVLLEDKDIRVRRAAIMSLRMLTGEFIEYRPDGSPAERAAAAARWDEYWQSRQ